MPVKKNNQLLKLADDLENEINQISNLTYSYGQKNLHVTIKSIEYNNLKKILNSMPSQSEKIDQYMLRVSIIKNKKFFAEYDFTTKSILSRKESLDKDKWKETANQFSKDTNLYPSPEGFIYDKEHD